jgi:6-phosphogluconolactonase
MGGNFAVYPILSRGYLGPAADFVQHEGHGTNPTRQEKAHAHSIQTDPTNQTVLVADLGLDEVKLYRLDLASGKLFPGIQESIPLHAGAGPRHIDFHPSNRWLYVVNELDSTLSVFSHDAEKGEYRHLQTVSALPEGYKGEKWAADVHVHPNGNWVYVSNRAHDSLAGFTIDPETGRVSLTSVAPSGGRTPRNFAIDPSGKWLLAANQNGDNLVVFAIEPGTGQLRPTGIEVAVPNPVCIKFAPGV